MKRTALVMMAGLVLGSLAASQGADPAPANLEKSVMATNVPSQQAIIRSRVDYMGRRYNLSDEQKGKVQTVIEEETQKFNEARQEANLKPEDRRAKYLAVREETRTRLKEIFTPEQWEAYDKTMQRVPTAPPGTNRPPATPAAPVTPPPATPAK